MLSTHRLAVLWPLRSGIPPCAVARTLTCSTLHYSTWKVSPTVSRSLLDLRVRGRIFDASRTLSSLPNNSPPPPEECQEVDPNDNSGEVEVYKGILSAQIKLVKGFSLTTSLIGLACQPVIYYKAQTAQSLGLVVATGAFISFFTFATPFLIHFVSKKYVTALYYNSQDDSYTAVTYGILLRPKKVRPNSLSFRENINYPFCSFQIKFRLRDVQVPDIPGMFTTFKAGNVPLFVDGQQFYQPQHFGKIMGYDKPLNLRWKEGVTESEYESRKRSPEEK